ncbi:hypothetical protein RB195_020957 [Necator americanus]|uniref:Core-2/I-Branching enzyme n=1 Tax=Necator americanus TaxID=51031 RepID=A0ABR1CNC1_NECAM
MRFNENRWTRAVSDWVPRDIERTTGRPPTRSDFFTKSFKETYDALRVSRERRNHLATLARDRDKWMNYWRPLDQFEDQRESGYFKYPERKDMGHCPPHFGKVSVFVAYSGQTGQQIYAFAQKTLQCYLKGTNYTLFLVDLDSDPIIQERCKAHGNVFYKKHCAAALYLPKTDWMLVIDADTGDTQSSRGTGKIFLGKNAILCKLDGLFVSVWRRGGVTLFTEDLMPGAKIIRSPASVWNSVINPNHCIEEWIDERVSIILYERFFNLEFAAGNYIVKNTMFGNNFLRKWSEYEFKQPKSYNGYDQGGLMMLLLESLIPEAVKEQNICHHYWKKASNYSTYMATVMCVRLSLGATTVWPGKVRFYRRTKVFTRDGWSTDQKWSDEDFMFHGWKTTNNLTWVTVFESKIDFNLCGKGIVGWKWHEETKITSAEMRSMFLQQEKHYLSQFPQEGRVNPLLDVLNIL